MLAPLQAQQPEQTEQAREPPQSGVVAVVLGFDLGLRQNGRRGGRRRLVCGGMGDTRPAEGKSTGHAEHGNSFTHLYLHDS